MDPHILERLLDEVDELAEAYGQMTSTEPELFALGFVASTRQLSWDAVREVRAGIDRRIDERNTEHNLTGMIESAILNPEFRQN